MKLTSKVNIRFTFSMTLDPPDCPTNTEYCAERLTNLLTVLLRQTRYLNFLCGTSNSVFINSTISVDTLKMFYRTQVGKHRSEKWKGPFESNALSSYQ